jgi:hypothetical protein
VLQVQDILRQRLAKETLQKVVLGMVKEKRSKNQRKKLPVGFGIIIPLALAQ